MKNGNKAIMEEMGIPVNHAPKVLIIDDSATSCLVMERVLKKEGYQVTIAGDGREGLMRILQEQPDCVLLDVVLPGMSGFEVCRHLKVRNVLPGLPVIMVSTKNTSTDKSWALRQGATHYLVKPFDEEELARLVKEVLANYGPPKASPAYHGRPSGPQEQVSQRRPSGPVPVPPGQEPVYQSRPADPPPVPPQRPAGPPPMRQYNPAFEQGAASPYSSQRPGPIPVREQSSAFEPGRPAGNSPGYQPFEPMSTPPLPPIPPTPPTRPYRAVDAREPLQLQKLIPERIEEAELLWRRSPHFLFAADKQARLLFEAIDGIKNVETLCGTTQMSVDDVLRTLRSLLAQHRIRLCEANGKIVNSSYLFPEHL